MKRLLMAILVVLMASTVFAQCPDDIGIFSTYDASLLPGRAAEAWCAGMPMTFGNELNTQSWDGSEIGSQWRVWGMSVDSVTLIEDNVVDGNGYMDYQINYAGGEFWLSKDHTWGDGATDLLGTVGMYHTVATFTYAGGNMVGATANISWNGAFSDCPSMNDCVVEFAIANSMLVWNSDSGLPEPVDYPGMLCGSDGDGEVHDQCCITMSLTCAIPTENTSWSGMKALYR